MRFKFLVFILILIPLLSVGDEIKSFKISCIKNLVASQSTLLQIELLNESDELVNDFHGSYRLYVNGTSNELKFIHGKSELELEVTKSTIFIVSIPEIDQTSEQITIKKWPAFLSILPPLIAIVLAILFKEVVLALCLGIFIGLVFLLGLDDPLNYLRAPLVFIDTYVIQIISDSSKASVIVFSMMIGGMVALMIKNGSIHFLVQQLMKYIKSRRATLFSTWILGILIFFDDYANTLIVGNAARSITDKFNISRQKLAYIVDSTAAPVAAIAFVTTWIGAQINYISDAIANLNLDESPYLIFLNSLGYAFYPLLTLFFVFILIRSGRDFGPMFKAEKLAITDFKKHLQVHEKNISRLSNENIDGFKTSWLDALVPIIGLILVAFGSLLYNDSSSVVLARTDMSRFIKIITIIGNGDPYKSMLWASLFGVSSSLIFTLVRRNLNLRSAVEGIIDGFKTMLIAMIILILAWVLGLVTEELHTATFLADLIGNNVPVILLPMLIFIVSAAIAFATGTSWGTMALLYPILLPAIYKTGLLSGFDHQDIMPYFHQVVAAILGGSVFGDHCSPISDTTIMSSMATSCDHLEHVKTQMPYALTVGIVSSVCGYFLVSITGFSPVLSYFISALILILVIYVFGKKTIPD